jgi:hypothetical protein
MELRGFGLVFPSRDEKSGHSACEVDCKLSMTSFWLHGPPTLPVSITNLIANGTEVVHHGLAVPEDSFEHSLLLLMGSEVQSFRCKSP